MAKNNGNDIHRPCIFDSFFPPGGGGGTQLFFGEYVEYVLRGFPKVGSRERISLKNEGSWERKFGNFASRELKFWPKARLKMQIFLKV